MLERLRASGRTGLRGLSGSVDAPAWLLWSMAALLAAVAARLTVFKLRTQPLFVDFLAMWTGGRMANAAPARLYDFAATDRAQAWLLGAAAHDRPFPYPPSSLLVFSPLGRLDFWIAATLWTGLTLAAFACVTAARLPTRRRAVGVALVLLTPGAVWAAISGQVSFFVGALVVGGMAMLERRPWLAGACLGVAAAFKPTVLLMAPVALIAGGHWRAMLGAALAGLAVVGLSVAVFGLGPWQAWIAAEPAFADHIIHNPRYFTGIITPTGLALQLGLTGWSGVAWRVGFAVVGVVMAVVVFRRTTDLAPRLTALIGGGLLISPYVMTYETALLAPGAVLAVLTATGARPRIVAALAFVALAVAGFPNVGAGALLVFLALSMAAPIA